MNKIIKTCLICENCDLDLGSEGYSDVTPGYAGSVSCNLNLFDDGTGEYGVSSLFVYVDRASECHAFKIHHSIQVK